MSPRPGICWLAFGLSLASSLHAPAADKEDPGQAAERTDLYGDPLPPEAVARMGTVRFRCRGGVEALAYSPDGKILAAGGLGDSVTLFEATGGKRLRQIDGLSWQVSSLAFSPDGKKLATLSDVSTKDVRTLRMDVWDHATGKHLQRFEFAANIARSVGFSANGQTPVYLACEGKTIKVREADGGKVIRELTGHTDRVLSAAFSSDGKNVTSAGLDKTFRLWDAADGKELRRVNLPMTRLTADSAPDLTFTLDGRLMALYSDHLRLYDVAKSEELPHQPDDGSPLLIPSYHFAFSPDGKTLAVGGGGGFAIRLLDTATGKDVGPTAGHVGCIAAVALSADGKFVATGGQHFTDHTVRLWDAVTGKELWKVESQSEVACMAIAPDGKTVAWGKEGFDGGIRMAPTDPNGELRQLPKEGNNVSHVVFSPDGRTLAAVIDWKKLQFWDFAAGKLVREIAADPGDFVHLAYSPNGKTLASSGDWDDVRLWDADTGKEVVHFSAAEEKSASVYSLAFSPDGKVLATAAEGENFIRLSDAASGKETLRITRWIQTPYEGRRSHEMIVFSPDGRTVASADGLDGSIYLYETATGECRHELKGHLEGVAQVAFSADGRLLVSAGYDCTALLWDLSGPAPAESWDVSPGKPDALWDELAVGSAWRAYHAIRTLSAGGEKTTAFLRTKLRPAPSADSKRIEKLIGDLNSDDLEVREGASVELARLGEAAADALRRTAKNDAPPETRRRAEELLEKLSEERPSPERLRAIRAVEALEHMGTKEAVDLLKTLAEGEPQARLTRDAAAALGRLAKRAAAP